MQSSSQPLKRNTQITLSLAGCQSLRAPQPTAFWIGSVGGIGLGQTGVTVPGWRTAPVPQPRGWDSTPSLGAVSFHGVATERPRSLAAGHEWRRVAF